MKKSLEFGLRECVQVVKDGVVMTLRVRPKSRVEDLKLEFSELIFHTKESPVKGKVNTALIKFLSKILEVPTSTVKIISGQKDRSKIVKIKGIPKDIAIRKLLNYLTTT